GMICLALRREESEPLIAWERRSIILWSALGSLVGFLVFAVTLARANGIQPVYVLQMFPLFAALIGNGWSRYFQRCPKTAMALLCTAGASAAYNWHRLFTNIVDPRGLATLVRSIPIGFWLMVALGTAAVAFIHRRDRT
ncbi:MAG: hypothetical protein SNJ52_02630, partial [Verrucomicrobiia bacterium]